MVDFQVEPGIVTVVLLLLFDLIAFPSLDEFLRIAVNAVYIRQISNNKTLLIKSANIPGVTQHLLGKRIDRINVLVAATKVLMLALVFAVEFHITSRTELLPTPEVRMGTFEMSPSDEIWQRPVVYTVARRFGRSEECVVQNGEELKYYRIAFRLDNGVMIDNDLGDPDVNTTNQYNVDDSSILCLKPGNVRRPAPLARVVTCSRKKPKGCADDTKDFRPATIPVIDDGSQSVGGGLFNITDYDPDSVAETWPEYEKPLLTCLSTYATNNLAVQRKNRNCLLVVRNGTHTIVELWKVLLVPDGRLLFISTYAGPVFEGDLAFGRYQSADLLATLSFVDELNWKRLAGRLVARSSEFVGNSTVEIGKLGTITEIPLWAVVLGGVAVGCAFFARIGGLLVERRGRLPQVNTTNGLSSILRQIQDPHGESTDDGKFTRIGRLKDEEGAPLRFRLSVSEEQNTSHQRDQVV